LQPKSRGFHGSKYQDVMVGTYNSHYKCFIVDGEIINK